MLLNNPKLRSSIKALWNAFWSGGIANPLTAIEQITYLLFMKQLDKLDTERERRAEFAGEKYESLFKGNFELPGIDGKPVKIPKSELRWSHFKQLKADVMLSHMQTKVFPFIKTLNGGTGPFTKHMASAVFLIPKPSLLVESVNTIEEIYAELEEDSKKGGHSFQDIQGDVYEYLLNEIATAGKNGQFRTPRHIIKMIVELVDPKPGDRIVDPACGTGGFLLEAHSYMKTKLLSAEELAKVPPDEDGFKRASVSGKLTKKVKQTLDKSLHGFDFDQTMVRLGLMNLMMHGIDDPDIDYADTLSKGFNKPGEYNVVMANPPFTGSIDKGDIHESLKLPTTKTELLFLERIYRMLEMGGTGAVIVPQGVLFGSQKAFVEARKLLVDHCELKAVITMPGGVFKPYAGVATAVLLFTKGGETKQTLFYAMDGDGYTLDDKRVKQPGTGDLQDVIERYTKREQKEGERTSKWFMVPKKEIVESAYDLSTGKYKEEVFEDIEYQTPGKIIELLKDMEPKIIKGLEEIERSLSGK
jgi:type I restriction enzyme M protein